MSRWRVGLRLLVWTQVGYLATIVAIVGLVGVARPVVLGLTVDQGASAPDGASGTAAPASAIVTISGTVVGQQPAILNVKERGGSHAVGFMVSPATAIRRGGNPSPLEHLQPGDRVNLVIDERTGRAERINAVAGDRGWPVGDWLAVAGPSALGALIVAAAVLAFRWRSAHNAVLGQNSPGGGRLSSGLTRPPALIRSTRVL